MTRREPRAVEYYGWALIAGIPEATARHMAPGRVVDLFNVRAKYDARLASCGVRL